MKKKNLVLTLLTLAVLLCGLAAAAETTEITAHDYLGEWVDEDGACNIDIARRGEGNAYAVSVRLDIVTEEEISYFAWAYACLYDEETRTLKSVSRASGEGDYAPDSQEQFTGVDFDYRDAAFYFDEAGKLIWSDADLNEDDAMAFGHTIGWMDPDYVGPGHHFAGEWNGERVSVSIEERMEDYAVFVSGSGSAFDGAHWIYLCDYDAATDSLISNDEMAARYDYAYDEAGEYSETVAYEDGEAVFSLNGDGKLVWDDRKENAGEGRAFERVPEVEEDEDRIVEPVNPGYDPDALDDGLYPVAFAPADLVDGALAFSVYSVDCYDIADIGALKEGDTFVFSGVDFEVESLERGDDLDVNGGLDNGGWTLRLCDGDNCWRIAMDDDYPTWTYRGEARLPLADEVIFTDGWDIEKEPAVATGAEAVAAAVAESEMDYFSPLNTAVRVEGGRIAEIIRSYMP